MMEPQHLPLPDRARLVATELMARAETETVGKDEVAEAVLRNSLGPDDRLALEELVLVRLGVIEPPDQLMTAVRAVQVPELRAWKLAGAAGCAAWLAAFEWLLRVI